MTDHSGFSLSRRALIQAGVAAGVAVTVGESFAAAANAPTKPGVIMRTIPSTGEKLPAVGVGTNAYGVSSAEDLAELLKVLSAMPGLGGSVIDTAQAYGTSEEVIGKLLADLGNRDKFFLATKTPLAGDISGGKAVLDNSFRRLGVSKIDLLQIHNVYGLDELMPHYTEYKAAGKIRYLGVTTSVDRQYEQMRAALGKHKFDFMQIDYSIGDRTAADNLLPMAQEKGLAVLNNTPFGGRGRSYFPRCRQAGAGMGEGIRCHHLGAVLPEVQPLASGDHRGHPRHHHDGLPRGQPGRRPRPVARRGHAQEDGRVLGRAAGLINPGRRPAVHCRGGRPGRHSRHSRTAFRLQRWRQGHPCWRRWPSRH